MMMPNAQGLQNKDLFSYIGFNQHILFTYKNVLY